MFSFSSLKKINEIRSLKKVPNENYRTVIQKFPVDLPN